MCATRDYFYLAFRFLCFHVADDFRRGKGVFSEEVRSLSCLITILF